MSTHPPRTARRSRPGNLGERERQSDPHVVGGGSRWADLYATGKHKGYAAPNAEPYLGRDSTWVEVDVPHDLYDADWNTEGLNLSSAQLERAERYARMPGPLPPGMAGYQGRRAKRRLRKLYVSDGNHRAYATFLRGNPSAHFYMPQNEWRHFQQVQQEAQI